jgi:DNA polymerase-3 subunit chi
MSAAATAIFYHLTTKGLDDTLITILTRAVGQDWRVMIRSPDADLIRHLDSRLWLDPADSFLPHGVEGSGQDAAQPILLGAGPITNAARALFLLSGAQATQTEATSLERIWLIFDGGDPAAVEAARAEWARMTGWGIAAQYWSDATGNWVKKTERPASP